MTPEVKKRYEDALDTLRSIVARTGDARDSIQALIRLTASDMYDALERDADADLDGIIEEFRAAVEAIVMENMRRAAKEVDDEGGESVADVALALTFTRVDISEPVPKYASALSQEVKWFVAGGFAYGALRDYLKDPQSFLASESTKPQQKKSDKTDGRTPDARAGLHGRKAQTVPFRRARRLPQLRAVSRNRQFIRGREKRMDAAQLHVDGGIQRRPGDEVQQ